MFLLLRLALLLASVCLQVNSFSPTPGKHQSQKKLSTNPLGLRHVLHAEQPSPSSSSEHYQQGQLTEHVSQDGTVRTLVDEETNQRITLIGTAHLSKKSNEQVVQIIQKVQPDVVMVELDVKRLERVGIGSPRELQIPYSTVDDIHCPPMQDDIEAASRFIWHSPLQNMFLDFFTTIARSMLTGMYNNMGESMELKGGGEFLAAITTVQEQNKQQTNKCTRIVLGDRDSLVTIRRAGELALRSGDALGVLNRLVQVSESEMSKLENEVRSKQQQQRQSMDEADIKVAIVEAMKSDPQMRNKLFTRLEEEVPEFARAFITERDYIMAEAIRREGYRGAKHIVAVVGAAHLPGMSKNLVQQSWNAATHMATTTSSSSSSATAFVTPPSTQQQQQLRQDKNKPGLFSFYNSWVRNTSTTFNTDARRTAADELR